MLTNLTLHTFKVSSKSKKSKIFHSINKIGTVGSNQTNHIQNIHNAERASEPHERDRRPAVQRQSLHDSGQRERGEKEDATRLHRAATQRRSTAPSNCH